MGVGGWLVFALGIGCAGAVLSVLAPPRRLPLLVAVAGSGIAAVALALAGRVLGTGQTLTGQLWVLPGTGPLLFSLDRLAALFLLLAGVVLLASSVFSAHYLRRYVGHASLRAFNAWYLLLAFSIVWILLASDVFGFLVAWELMSLSSYLLVNFEHRREGTPGAAFLMLALGEAGFMAVLAVLVFLAVRAGSFDFSALAAAAAGLGPATRGWIFLLTFLGFGVKAGLVPVNAWLPRAHPAAPANVSAILSGTILNLGLYGIVRVNLDLVPLHSVAAGIVILGIGTISALVGILYATTADDLKELLAHSSIENIGIVTVGLGAGVVFAAAGLPLLAGMAYIAAFYHMANHSVYKSLLFLGAGAVDQGAGTRDLNRLGGLIRAMPWTGGTFLIGALAIAGLPPFSGFVSEWLTLQTLLRGAELPWTSLRIVLAISGAGLALTAGLAVTCFVKAFAMGFLGMARSQEAEHAVEAGRAALAPLLGLALLCLLLGVLPTFVIPALGRQLRLFVPAGASAALVPPFFAGSPGHAALPAGFASDFHNIGAQVGQSFVPGPGLVILHRGGVLNPVVFAASPSYMLFVLAGLLLAVFLVVRLGLSRRRALARQTVWDGGIRHLLPEMTYTATGFSNPVRVIFQAIFRPTTVEDTRETVAQHFRTAIRRQDEAAYLADRIVLRPARRSLVTLAHQLARMHHGRLNAYLTYLLLSLLAVLIGFTLH